MNAGCMTLYIGRNLKRRTGGTAVDKLAGSSSSSSAADCHDLQHSPASMAWVNNHCHLTTATTACSQTLQQQNLQAGTTSASGQVTQSAGCGHVKN
jgi:hypothetical protein